MYFQNIILLATAASAAALPSKLVAREGGNFEVTNFKAYRETNSQDTIVNFDLVVPGSGLSMTHCTGKQATPADEDSDEFKSMTHLSGQCGNRDEFFGFSRTDAHSWTLSLFLANTDGRLTKGTHKFTRKEDVYHADKVGTLYEKICPTNTSFEAVGVTDAM